MPVELSVDPGGTSTDPRSKRPPAVRNTPYAPGDVAAAAVAVTFVRRTSMRVLLSMPLFGVRPEVPGIRTVRSWIVVEGVPVPWIVSTDSPVDVFACASVVRAGPAPARSTGSFAGPL
jgi:hypothetical protein